MKGENEGTGMEPIARDKRDFSIMSVEQVLGETGEARKKPRKSRKIT